MNRAALAVIAALILPGPQTVAAASVQGPGGTRGLLALPVAAELAMPTAAAAPAPASAAPPAEAALPRLDAAAQLATATGAAPEADESSAARWTATFEGAAEHGPLEVAAMAAAAPGEGDALSLARPSSGPRALPKWLLVPALAATPVIAVVGAKAAALGAAGAALVVAAIALYRAFRPVLAAPTPAADPLAFDVGGAAERLARALSFRTISYQDPKDFPAQEFAGFRAFIEKAFPNVHAALGKELVNEHSLLYTWKGSDPSLKPILLMAHYDVVPVEPGTEGQWKQPPFAGKVADGFIWGRGAADDKGPLLGILEAVEVLVAQGYKPKRTIYIASGHDEEVGGMLGNAKVAELLRSRGVKLEAVFDEGGRIVSDLYPGVKKPLAQVSVAEKGYLTIGLQTQAQGGHSSMPPLKTSIGQLGAAIHALESRPFPLRMTGTIRRMLEAMAPHLPFMQRVMFSNLWLFRPLIERQLARSPTGNAILRTTVAPTIISGGVKENVLPSKAGAIANLRLLAGDTVDGALARVRAVVGKDVSVSKTTAMEHDPSPESSLSSRAYRELETTIRQVAPDVAAVIPGLLPGITDSRHFGDLTETILRFSPGRFSLDDLKMIHGANERLSVENYAEYPRFFAQLIRNLDR